MPSLILRLEHLASPVPSRAPDSVPDAGSTPSPTVEAPTPPTADGVAAAAGASQHSEPAEPTASAARVEDADDVEPPPPPTAAPRASERPEPAFTRTAPPEIAASARRIVDLTAPERLIAGATTSLSRWSAAVAAAHDACFVLDPNGIVISVSTDAIGLLGVGDSAVVGRHVLDVIRLVDLETGAVHPEYAPRITPLVVLDGPGLARSLMRVRHSNGVVVTLDTSSAPIHDADGNLLGSVSFLAPIPTR